METKTALKKHSIYIYKGYNKAYKSNNSEYFLNQIF